MSLAACGICAFHTLPTASVAATVKKVPEDFLVVEIDPLGALTDDCGYVLPEGTTPSAAIQPDAGTRSDAPVCDTKAASVARPIGELLSNEVKSELERRFGGEAPDAFSVQAPAAQLPLGVFTNREERRLLHNWIPWLYPHIRVQAQSTDTPEELLAASCTDYFFFLRLLGKEVAVAIIRSAVRGLPVQRIVLPWWRQFSKPSKSPGGGDLRRRTHDLAAAEWFVMAAEFSSTSSKDDRRDVHEKLRASYRCVRCRVQDGRVQLTFSVALAVDGGDGVALSLASDAGGCSSSNTTDQRPHRDVFTHLVIQKRDMDVFAMREALAHFFGVPVTAVCLAGMKDKRAITTQRCSVPGDHSGRILSALQPQADAKVESFTVVDVTATLNASVCGADHHVVRVAPRFDRSHKPPHPMHQGSWVHILACRTGQSPIAVGSLGGNQFTLTLREAQLAGNSAAAAGGNAAQLFSVLQKRLEIIKREGFLNYFGTQRFGNVLTLASHTGIHILAGRWCAAVRSLLEHASPDLYAQLPENLGAKYALEKRQRSSDAGSPAECDGVSHGTGGRDAAQMFKCLRLAFLSSKGHQAISHEDVVGEVEAWREVCRCALERMPFHLRALWLHAAQSVLFNFILTAVAERTRDSGSPDISLPTHLPLLGNRTSQRGPDVDGTSPPPSQTSSGLAELHSITQGVLRMFDISMDDFARKPKVLGVPLPGSLRPCVVRPSNAYLSLLKDVAEGVCLEVRFALPPSSYATVFLRELLGGDAGSDDDVFAGTLGDGDATP